MRFDNISQASHHVPRLAEQLYNFFTSGHKDFDFEGAKTFEYRLSITDRVGDYEDTNAFLYVTLTQGGSIWITKSDGRYFDMEITDFIFPDSVVDEMNSPGNKMKAKSYRRYVFSDCMSDMVKECLEEAQRGMQNPSSPYLWNSFDLVRSWGKEDVMKANGAKLSPFDR